MTTMFWISTQMVMVKSEFIRYKNCKIQISNGTDQVALLNVPKLPYNWHKFVYDITAIFILYENRAKENRAFEITRWFHFIENTTLFKHTLKIKMALPSFRTFTKEGTKRINLALGISSLILNPKKQNVGKKV